MHLTNESLERLLAGTADGVEARALADHLESPCARCEAILAAQDGVALDALADHALSAIAPRSDEERGNDLEFARIQRALRATPVRRRRWIPAAVAAAVLAAGVAGMQLATDHDRGDRWDGVKGQSPATRVTAIPVRLSAVAVVTEPRAEPRVWRIASGDELPASASLQLRIELGGPAELAIARLGPDGEVDLFWREHAKAAGALSVSIGGRPAAYPLAQLSGWQRFVVVASGEALTPDRVRSVMGAITADGRAVVAGAGPGGLSVDVISVRVR